MTRIVEGSSPKAPIQELVGFEIIEAEEGRTVFSAIPGPQHLNPIGTVHGGFAGLLLDSCMGAAVHTTGKLLAHGTSTCMILAADGAG